MPAALKEGLGPAPSSPCPNPLPSSSPAAGPADALPSPSWAARAPCYSFAPGALQRRPLADPRPHPTRTNGAQPSRLEIPIPSGDGRPACFAPGWRQGRTHPAKRLLLLVRPRGATLWRHWCSKLDAQAATDLARTAKPNPLASAAAAVPGRLRHRRCALMRSVAQDPAGERWLQQTLSRFPHPRPLARRRGGRAPARNALPRGALNTWPVAGGALAGSGRQDRPRPAVSRVPKPQRHGPQPAWPEPGRSWRWHRSQ